MVISAVLTSCLSKSSKTNNDGRKDEGGDAAGDEQVSLLARAFPFVKDPAPHGAEDDDAGHVQSPTGESVFVHLRLAHRVEEELEIPQRPHHDARVPAGRTRRDMDSEISF